MYGIVNKAIHGLVVANYGEETWKKIKAHAEIDIDYFLSNQPYDDDITYKLVDSASKVLEVTAEEILVSFGEFWILETGMKNYGSLMTAGGTNFREFMINLPDFHSRIMLIYPNLIPPEFKVSEINERELQLHYYSLRAGLTYFVIGLVKGIGKLFETKVDVLIVSRKDEGANHDIFKLKW